MNRPTEVKRLHRLALALAITALGLAAVSPQAFAASPGRNGRLAFASDGNGNVDIHSMNPDGPVDLDIADVSDFCSYGGSATREATRKPGDIPVVRDPRVRAIVLMAPNTAPFTNEALAQVTVPVRVYGAERDDLTLVRYHAERLAKALPPQTEYVLVTGADHFSFITRYPWGLKLVAGEAARDPEGFDRDAMHEVMNREIVAFFDRKLPSG